MPDHSPSAAPGSTGWIAACILSAIVHFTAIVLLVRAIDTQPSGAGSGGGDAGIILCEAGPRDEPAGGGSTSAPPAAPLTPVVAAPAPLPPIEGAQPLTAYSPAAAPTAQAAGVAANGEPRIAQAPGMGSGRETGNYGAGTGQASVRVFGVEGKGTRFVYVFDRSSSMEGAPLATAKQQLLQSLDSLSSVHQFHIIFFNQSLRNFDLTGGGKRVAFATDRNKKQAARFVGGVTADGGTDRLPALRAAIAMNPDVIFFLTDADDPMPASELAEIAAWNERAGVAISTIEFGRGPQKQAQNFLTELARTTGGQYGYVDTTRLGGR